MNDVSHIIMLLLILFLLRKNYSKKVIWFYMPNCGHCKKMQNEWDKFELASTFTLFPPIETKKVNINEEQNAELSKNYEVQGVPFIVKLENDGLRNVYDGRRTSEDLFKWACA